MYFVKPLAALVALVTVSTATPTPNKPPTGFTVEQVGTGRRVRKNGAIQVEKTFKKYGAHVPASVKVAAASASSTQSGSVVATPEAYDQEYLCPVQIGTPAQTLMLDFDTGSSDLWVFSGQQKASQKTGHKVYTIKNSKSAVLDSGASWKINYGDGSGASGNVYYDKVVVGAVTATSQAVEAATSVSGTFITDTANDGLLGLASSTINTVSPNQVTTFFDTIKSSLPSALFTSYLQHSAPGYYGFGFINASLYSGAITYTPISFANGYWEFKAGGYSVGSTAYTSTLDCIADTGTSLIYMPDAVITNYYAQVSGASNSATYGGYIFPCSSTLPTFSVKASGVSYTVPATYMNYAPIDGTNCFGSLQSSDGIGLNILGDVFLKSVYVVFDEGNSRIGFAKQA